MSAIKSDNNGGITIQKWVFWLVTIGFSALLAVSGMLTSRLLASYDKEIMEVKSKAEDTERVVDLHDYRIELLEANAKETKDVLKQINDVLVKIDKKFNIK